MRYGRGDGLEKSILGLGGLWGWGEPPAKYFDASKLNVVNRAVGGLSARTYLTIGYRHILLKIASSFALNGTEQAELFQDMSVELWQASGAIG